ncbi:YdeI/OmpD-associated family protein [Tellurirhabdus rosea]|uniref:YdeI/OmpD-associated family protein n=1 Tax=Tellurirhabdus rosea TaxID=2674997 RepID=UPI00225A3408|nr:YdeI/OmpD-associated family protein [Tellurirhabdus rosea]
MQTQPVFSSRIQKFDSPLWGFHFVVPADVAGPFISGNDRRVVCTLNGRAEFQCALMPLSGGGFFINVNKKIRDSLGLAIGSEVQFTLKKDESEYGLPMPEEMHELLQMDDEGHRLFHALTPGKQRTLLYFIGSVKSMDRRISRALAVVDHLKITGGKVDFRLLNESVRVKV